MKLIINSETSLQRAIGEVLSYCPDTGTLRWKVARGRCRAGEVAGYDSGRGYIGIRIFGKCYYAHRIAFLMMTGRFPKYVDHIDGDRANNRWANLREVSKSENGMNMGLPRTNKSGVIGVFWNTEKRKWTAQIKKDQVNHHLGHFDELGDAIDARREAESRLGFHENHGSLRNVY